MFKINAGQLPYILYKLSDNLSGNAAYAADTAEQSFKGTNSLARALSMLLIFGIVLFITYATTKFVGKTQKGRFSSRNLEVLEALRISDGKLLELVRIGGKYVVIASGREEVHFICEVQREELDLRAENGQGSFPDILKSKVFSKTEEVPEDEDPSKTDED